MARFRHRHDPLTLDDSTVNALLSGAVEPDDAPPGYGPVARVLAAAASPPQPHETEAEQQMLARFHETIGAQPRPATARRPHRRPRVLAAIALTTGGLLVGAGVAAASGHLPGPLQQVAHTSLAHIGISIPGDGQTADEPSGPTATTSTTSDTTVTTADPAARDDRGQSMCSVASDGICDDNHGQQVCAVASDGTCVDPHGQEICTLASDGTCRAASPPTPNVTVPPTTPDHGSPPTSSPPNPSDGTNNSSGGGTSHTPDTPPSSANPNATQGQARNNANS
jgi:hypothetical protein